MSGLRSGRPKRLWVAVIMNIVVGLAGLFLIAFISLSSSVPEDARPDAGSVVLAVATAGFLVISSTLALLGKWRWGRLMLVAALLYYGIILVQNAYLLVQAQGALIPAQKVTANVVRSGLEIAINMWAILTARGRAFFRSA